MSLQTTSIPAGELYTENDFRQLVVTIETTPAFLGGLGELEDHGERGLVRKTSFGAQVSTKASNATSELRGGSASSATPFCQGLPGSINAVPMPCAERTK